MTTKRSDDLHYLWWLALAASVGLLFYLLSPILAPFLFAAILAYICDPLVDKLAARKIPRTAGVVLTLVFLLVLFIALLLILVPLIERETQLFIAHLPGYIDWLRTQVAPHLQALGIDLKMDGSARKTRWQRIGRVPGHGGQSFALVDQRRAGARGVFSLIWCWCLWCCFTCCVIGM